MLRLFLFSWILYYVGLIITPITIIYPNAPQALLIQLSFICLVFIGYGLLMWWFDVEPPGRETGEIFESRALVTIALALSALGLCMLVYDKLLIQGIDYSQGLAVAREQWRRLGLARSGPSSIFSVGGYLLSGGYFVAVILVTVQYHLFSRWERFSIYAAVFFLALANSVISGGRSSLIVLLAAILVAPRLRTNAKLRDLFPGSADRFLIGAMAFLLVGYSLYVTSGRAAAVGMPTQIYVKEGLVTLGFELDDWFVRSFDGSRIGSIVSIAIFTGSYLTHSFATVCAMISAPNDGQTIVFVYPLQLLARLGLMAPPQDQWFLAGRFPSLPGAVWFQYGTLGLVLSGLGLGVANALGVLWSSRQPHALLPAGYHALVGVILVLSPLLFAGDFLAFPFAVISFLMLAVAQRFLGRIRRRRRQDAVPGAIAEG